MVKTEQITDPQVFFDYLTSDEINVLDADLVSDDLIEIRYEYTDNFIKPDAKTNVVIATFTTAYARLKLYGVLDMLHERVLYYDTDSVIFVSKPNEPEPPLGNHLGELTDELGGDHITVFASGCPKNYCYCTNTGKVEMSGDGAISVHIPFKIMRNTQTKEVETKRMKKDYRIVYDKHVIVDNYKTLPYGY